MIAWVNTAVNRVCMKRMLFVQIDMMGLNNSAQISVK